MDSFWNRVWDKAKPDDYKCYINLEYEYEFIRYFKKEGLINICDAGCGFGKYSSILSYNGFRVNGFDISEDSVKLTRAMLSSLALPYESYKVCSITNIDFQDSYFDGAVANAVIDHLTLDNAYKAIDELFRITKKNGLIYISFDGLEDDDISSPHNVLADGSYEYTEGNREGMIFRYYSDEDIEKLLSKLVIIWENHKKNGVREVIIRNK